MPADRAPSATDLLKAVGLRPDGPVLWGRPVPADRPGVYLIELLGARQRPIEATRVGKWIERVPERLDGERPTFRTLQARLQAFWLAGQTVLYIGAARTRGGRRVAAQDAARRPASPCRRPLAAHVARPRASACLVGNDRCAGEYEDALLGAFADGVRPAGASTPEPDLVLPWRCSTADRRAPLARHRARCEPAAGPAPERRCRAAARRSRGAAPTPLHRRTPRLDEPRAASGAPRWPGEPPPRASRASTPAKATPAAVAPTKAPTEVHLSPDGLARLEAELHELRAVRRPDAIRRVATAREHGDLKENAEYHAAREELGFIVGRIHSLEDRLRHVVIVEAADSETAVMGSTVVVEVDGETSTYLLVGSTDSDPGRPHLDVVAGRAGAGPRARRDRSHHDAIWFGGHLPGR
jgi:transcription elongation factor GreA